MVSHPPTQPDRWILVRGARQLLTLHHHTGPRRAGALANIGAISDGSVLLHNGVIDAVGPTRRIENILQAREAVEIDAAGRVVMPAFVDAHACLIPSPAHGADPFKTVHYLPAGRLEAQANVLLKIMASHGTATIGAVAGNPPDASGELKILRALQSRNAHPLDLLSILTLGEYFGAAEDLLQCVRNRKLSGIAQARCAEGDAPLSVVEELLSAAQVLGFSVRLELAPRHNPGAMDLAARLGALSVSTAGDLTVEEVEILAGWPGSAILLPERFTGESRPCGRRLIDAGAVVALGSGLSPESGSSASMQAVVQLACTRFGLAIEEAICGATCNAAWALGVGATTGSLERGRIADLLLLNVSDYREIPLFRGTNLVHMLVKRGVVVFKEDFSGWPADP